MIQYLEIEQTLAARGVFFTSQEFVFSLCVMLEEEPQVAYAYAFLPIEFKQNKGSETERDFLAKCLKESNAILQQPHIKHLIEELKYRHQKTIQDLALHLDDIELTSSDIKKILASFLRDRIDDPSSASVKELVDLLRMYQPYLPDDASATDFQRHFIQVHDPFNALCINCNHEFTAYKGVSCVCEHCGTKYIWSEDEERFYPQPAQL